MLLLLVAVKMLLSHDVKFNEWITLGAIAVILGAGLLASKRIKPKPPSPE